MSVVRLFDTQPPNTNETEVETITRYITNLGKEQVYGRNIRPATIADIKREATNATTRHQWRNHPSWDYTAHEVPDNVPMGTWKKKVRAGCLHYFEKHSKDGRYRIELEVN